MSLLSDAIRDGKTGSTSTKRIVLIFGALCLGLTVLMLGVAALLGHDVGIAITGVAAPLAGMSGYGYVGGKRAESGWGQMRDWYGRDRP